MSFVQRTAISTRCVGVCYTALQLAQRVATLSPRAVTFSKNLIHQARQGTPRSAALALERERFIDLFDGEDQQEGVKAFLDKRKPVWKNA